jgi:hypothetical protein
MDFKQWDFPTRAGFVASVMAILGVFIPPIGVASAMVAVAFSGTAWLQARRAGESNPVARLCCIGCAALIAVVIIGNAIYADG